MSMFNLLFGRKGFGIWILPLNFKEKVEAIISDSDRQKKVIEIYDNMAKIFVDYGDNLKKMIEIHEIKIESTRSKDIDYYHILDTVLKERLAMEAKLLAARMDLVNNINKDEWVKIFAHFDEKVIE